MTPQEKIIIAVAEVQGYLDYRSNECEDWYADPAELAEDINKMNNILNDVLDYVHLTYENKAINNSK
jgi:hypothetical protein